MKINNKNTLSIIILNYNNYLLIKQLLLSLINNKDLQKIDYEIIVIDDNSTEDDVYLLLKQFPMCKIIETNKNNGFVKNCNIAVKYTKNEILLFLNNDMELKKINLKDIFEKVYKKEIFAVSPAIIRPKENFKNETISLFIFKNGIVQSENLGLQNQNIKFDKEYSIAWACGGCMFVEKSKFLRLGGFDEIFAPIYVEDCDLSYRAWKLGYKNLYLPTTIFYHYANSTMKKILDNKRLNHLVTRNRFLFFWKNITDLNLWIKHIFYILLLFIKLDFIKLRALGGAIKRLSLLKLSPKKENISDFIIQKKYNAEKLQSLLPLHIKKIYKICNNKNISLKLKFLNLLPFKIKKYFIEKLGYCFKPPKKITLCPSSICNLKCPLCPVGLNDKGRTKKLLSFDLAKKLLDEIGDRLEAIDLYNWGEPFLNLDLVKIIKYIKHINPNIHIVLSTNLTVVNDNIIEEILNSGLDEIWFSIDGADNDSYSKYRVGSNFDTVYKNMVDFITKKKEIKSSTHLQWRYHVMKQNEHLIEKAQRMAEQIGIEIFFGIIRTNMGSELLENIPDALERDRKWIPTIEKYQGYDIKNQKRKSNTNCDRPFWESVVNSNGSVSPCCCVWEEKYDYGNITYSSFMDIWNNKKYRLSRLALKAKNINNNLICIKCKKNGFRHM